MFAVMPETLAPEGRKPFALRNATALSSVRLLFANGVGLRRLALASGLFQVASGHGPSCPFRHPVLSLISVIANEIY
jgi:hypothetical protein